MIKHYPNEEYPAIDFDIQKNNKKWITNITLNNVDYQLTIKNNEISFIVTNCDFKDRYVTLGDSENSYKIIYYISYFIWLYLNETNTNTISYRLANSDVNTTKPKLFNRGFENYFNNPTITQKSNRYTIEFIEE